LCYKNLQITIEKEEYMVAIGRNDPCPCGSGKKYKHCCLGKEPPPRMSSLMDELKAAIAGKTFQSLDEANAFAQAFTESKNRVSQLDFLGLSSEQMHRFLDFPFVRTREIVEIDMDLSPAAFREIPVVENALIFLGRLAEQEPLKATAKGNTPVLRTGGLGGVENAGDRTLRYLYPHGR